MFAFIAYPLTERRFVEIVDHNETRKRELLAAPAVAKIPLPPVT